MEIVEFDPSRLDEVQAVLKDAFFREDSHPEYNEWEFARRVLSSEGYLPHLCLMAEEQGKIVGYNTLTVASLEGERGLALGPLAVAPSYQGKGIGSALVKRSIERAKNSGYPWILVLGGEFYSRFGFEKASPYGITISDNAFENEHLQILFLNTPARNCPKGKLIYCDAFYDGDGNLL